MEKHWIVRPLWKVTGGQQERWTSLVKYHMHVSKQCVHWRYTPHTKIRWNWYSYQEWVIPLKDGALIKVTNYWHLTPEKGWLETYATGIGYSKGEWFTELDPWTADHIIHWSYFPCFTDRAVQQAIRGEKYLWCKHQVGHQPTGQVPSLQYLALRVYTNGLRRVAPTSRRGSSQGSPQESQRRDTRMARNMGFAQRAVRRMAPRHVTGPQFRGPVPLPKESPFPSLVEYCGRTSH
ncbi:vif protein [Simian immunodeficiency virus - agm.sab-1]|uniref:Virion infectivity factor n=1 Tax=Simian immunodeficiency virus - agm.sab-1 TaxID=349974 RepID=Q87109_SIVSA|nr:vif protein - simian immunodeficiency virus SIVagm (isolate SAB-1) [Simian immunodeficiency virus - agm]AAA21506.1 vif protein [Simian immunodeficiency virus - agm.sab-1]